jgi:hypothetical protein
MRKGNQRYGASRSEAAPAPSRGLTKPPIPATVFLAKLLNRFGPALGRAAPDRRADPARGPRRHHRRIRRRRNDVRADGRGGGPARDRVHQALKAGRHDVGVDRGMQTRSGTAACGEDVEMFYEDLGDPDNRRSCSSRASARSCRCGRTASARSWSSAAIG